LFATGCHLALKKSLRAVEKLDQSQNPNGLPQRGQLMGRFKAQKWQKRIFQRGAFDRSLVAVVAAKSQNSDHVFICAETSGM